MILMSPFISYVYILAADRCACVLNESERRMPVVGLLTALAQMSTHRSGIQGTEGAWRVGRHPIRVIFLLRVWHCLFPTCSPCADQPLGRQSPKYPNILCGGLHLPFPMTWSQCVWGKVIIFHVSQLKKKGLRLCVGQGKGENWK